jgi:hypothetical protein
MVGIAFSTALTTYSSFAKTDSPSSYNSVKLNVDSNLHYIAVENIDGFDVYTEVDSDDIQDDDVFEKNNNSNRVHPPVGYNKTLFSKLNSLTPYFQKVPMYILYMQSKAYLI